MYSGIIWTGRSQAKERVSVGNYLWLLLGWYITNCFTACIYSNIHPNLLDCIGLLKCKYIDAKLNASRVMWIKLMWSRESELNQRDFTDLLTSVSSCLCIALHLHDCIVGGDNIYSPPPIFSAPENLFGQSDTVSSSVWLWVFTKNLISPHLRANGQGRANCKSFLQCGPDLDCSIWCLQICVMHLLFEGLLCLYTVFTAFHKRNCLCANFYNFTWYYIKFAPSVTKKKRDC